MKEKGAWAIPEALRGLREGDLKVDLSIGPESGLKLESGRLYLLPSFYAR